MSHPQPEDEIRIVILGDAPKRAPLPPTPPPPPATDTNAAQPADENNTPSALHQAGQTALHLGTTAATAAMNAASKLTTSLWQSESRQKAWESEQRKALTAQLAAQAQTTAEAGKAKSKEVLDAAVDRLVTQRIAAEKEKIKTKVQETDWQELAQQTASASLRGLSAGLAGVAAKLKATTQPEEPPPPADDKK